MANMNRFAGPYMTTTKNQVHFSAKKLCWSINSDAGLYTHLWTSHMTSESQQENSTEYMDLVADNI